MFNGIKIGRHSHYLLTSLDGENDGTSKRNEKEYIDSDGAEICYVYYNMRSFKVTGYILTDSVETAEKRRRKLIEACSLKKGFILTYFNGVHKYSAHCRVDELPYFEKINNKNYKYIINFIMPKFYWEDVNSVTKHISFREDMIHGELKLPMVFTQLYNYAEVRNLGAIPVYPIFTVSVLSASDESELIISNQTTGKCIGVKCALDEGEVITFNNNEGTVCSSVKGNIFNKLIKTTDFWKLESGTNVVNCDTVNVQVKIEYKALYTGV